MIFLFLNKQTVSLTDLFLCCVQRELLCQQVGLSPSVSQEVFEAAVFERIGRDQFRMETLQW